MKGLNPTSTEMALICLPAEDIPIGSVGTNTHRYPRQILTRIERVPIAYSITRKRKQTPAGMSSFCSARSSKSFSFNYRPFSTSTGILQPKANTYVQLPVSINYMYIMYKGLQVHIPLSRALHAPPAHANNDIYRYGRFSPATLIHCGFRLVRCSEHG